MVKRPNRFNSYQGPKLYSLLPNDIQSDNNLPYSQRDAILFYWKAEYSSFFRFQLFPVFCVGGCVCVRACVRGWVWVGVCVCVLGGGGYGSVRACVGGYEWVCAWVLTCV